MAEQQEKISRGRRKELLGRLKAEIGPHGRDLYLAELLSWIQFLMRLFSFYVMAELVADLYQGKAISLKTFVLQVLAANLVGYLVSQLAKKFQGRASQFARNQLKAKFFKAFEGSGGDFDSELSQADIMTVASQGIDSLDTYFQHYLSIRLRAIFNCLTVLMLVTFIFPLGGLIFLLALPLIPVSIIAMQKRSKKIMNHYWATYMDVGNLFMDNLQGMNTLYTYGADASYEASFKEKAEAFRCSTMELLGFQLQSVGYMDGVMYLGVGVSGFFASLALAQGSMSLFDLIFFVLIASEFFSPIREMGYGMHLVMMNTKMADRIYSFLDSVSVSDQERHSEAFPELIQEVRFDRISFAYDGEKVLSDISVTLPKGQIFAVAGESGLGKTTLAKLLQKRLLPEQGEIYLDTLPLSVLSARQVQEEIMYVSPDAYLFNLSIYDNLAMVTNLDKEDIWSWSKKTGLMRFLEDLPEGLDTLVGEDGCLLSPGQRQQVLCARALLAKKSVYIFDEMTSSVDSDNEQVLFDYIKAVSKEAIVLFISHKMKQVLEADQILFMDRQKKVQLGTGSELLAINADFKNLVETQEELEAILHG